MAMNSKHLEGLEKLTPIHKLPKYEALVKEFHEELEKHTP